MWSLGLLVSTVFYCTFPFENFPEIKTRLALDSTGIAVAIILVPFILLTEVLVFSAFGTTFGKWLLKVKIVTVAGKPLTVAAYARRQISIYFFGLAAAIPLASFFALAHQNAKIKHSGCTSYDAGKFLVTGNRISYVRMMAVCIAAGFFAILNFTASVALSKSQHLEQSSHSSAGFGEPSVPAETTEIQAVDSAIAAEPVNKAFTFEEAFEKKAEPEKFWERDMPAKHISNGPENGIR